MPIAKAKKKAQDFFSINHDPMSKAVLEGDYLDKEFEKRDVRKDLLMFYLESFISSHRA